MRNLTMMTDLYQLTMMYGYYKHGMSQNEAGIRSVLSDDPPP